MTVITSSRCSGLQSLSSPSAHKGRAKSDSTRPGAHSPKSRPQGAQGVAPISILICCFQSPGGCRFLSLGLGAVMRSLQGG